MAHNKPPEMLTSGGYCYGGRKSVSQHLGKHDMQPLIAQVGSHNLAVGIDQVVLWYAAYAILHGNRVAPPFEVRYVYPRQTVLFDGLQPSLAAAFAIERYTEHFQPFIFVSFVGLYQVGVFRPAGGAPAGPEVDQHIAAAVV